jgi:hypothetical protein
MVWKTLSGISYPTTIYASWYHQIDPGWDIAADGSDNNFKVFDFSNGSTPYTMNGSSDSNWYYDYQQAGSYPNTYIPWETPDWEINDDGGSLVFPDQNSHSRYWYGGSSPLGEWTKEEVEIRITNQNTGYAKAWSNGVLVVDYAGPTDQYAGATKTLGIGGYARQQTVNSWQYFADIYLDTTSTRALVCAGSSYATRGNCEIQIPSAWSTTSATVTVNQGSFADNSTAYAYVVDSSGVANANGYPITFGGSGSDTTAPSAPSGLNVI